MTVPAPARAPSPVQLATLEGQPVIGWRDAAGRLLPVGGAAPGPDLVPVVSDRVVAVPIRSSAPIAAASLQVPKAPIWRSAWLAHVRANVRSHALVALGAAFVGAALALARSAA